MSSNPIHYSSHGSAAEPPAPKKPAGSVKEVPRGDFVSIQSHSVLLDKLEEIANLANEATAADGIAIALRQGNQFLCRASLGFAPEVGVAVQPGQGVCGQCLAESRLVLSQNLPGQVKSALAAPIVIDGQVHGLIAAFSFRAGAFAASHSDLLCCLASDIAKGVDPLDPLPLITRESLEFAAPSEPELQPVSRDQRLAIIEAVTAPATPELGNSAEASAGPVEFHLVSYDSAEPAAYDFDENTTLQRPFRNHWDIVVILAAVLILALTFGIWLRHRHNQPYQSSTGQLTNHALSTYPSHKTIS
jgi:GAF domain